MTGLFLKMVNMSISASWLVLAVIVLRFVLKKAPKWLNPVLWGIVGLRLICPFSIESAWSLIPSAETINTTRYASRPYIESGIRAVDRPVNEYLGARYVEGVTVPANNFSDITTVFGVIWLLGIIALLLYTFVSYYRLRKQVETAVLLRDNIYQSENIVSPFVLGVWRPRIYLPFYIEEKDRIHVIAHEQTHIRRHDHWMKPFGFLLLTLYWFHPVLWAAYILLCRDIELACDERVIRELGTEERADYSQALLNCSVSRKSISACPLAFGESGVKARVKNVLNYKKPAFWMILMAMISCIAAAVCFLTDPFKKEPVDPAAILGKTYSIGRIVYTDGSELPPADNEKTPDYRISEEWELYTNESGEWSSGRMLAEIYLTKENFDNCFIEKEGWDKGTAGGLRRTNEKVWQAVNEEEGIFYYILLQENGELYLTRGRNAGEIQRVFRLAPVFVTDEEKSSPFGYMGYSGYLDECSSLLCPDQ